MYVYEAVYVLAVPELNGLLILMERKLHPESRCQFLKKNGREVFNNDVLRLLTVPIF